MQPKGQQRNKKGQQKPEYKNLTAFKAQEKHYKLYQNQQTDFSTLFVPKQQNFVEVDGFQVCELPFPQGAYYVKGFTPYEKVIQIGYFGLNHYWRRPYRTNLDSREQLYQNNDKQQNKNEIAHQKQEREPQKQEEKHQTMEAKDNYYFNQKIRWANVGYQYDWTLRKYPEVKTPMHYSIQELSNRANKLYNSIQHIKKAYEPESAIINYYGLKDSMTGHLDDAEIDQESPIYSFSFGLSCIFLMGGRTKEEEPTAIKLNSGDLLIMAGESRKCYHGVPRILQSTFPKPALKEEEESRELIKVLEQKNSQAIVKEAHNCYDSIRSYFSSHRININIRQVYPLH